MNPEVTTVILALGDFLTIYLYRYMHKTFYAEKEWVDRNRLLIYAVYLLDWAFLLGANLLAIPPVNLGSMVIAYLVPMYLCYHVKDFRGIGYYAFYMVGCMVMEVVFGITFGYMNNNMGFKTQYDVITPQVSMIMNLLEIVLVLAICRFGSKEKSKRLDKILILFMIMPVFSVLLILADSIMLCMGIVEDFNPGQFMRLTILLLAVNVVLFVILEKYTKLVKHDMEMSEEQMRLKSDADIMEMAAKTMKERLMIAEQVMQQDRVMRHDRRHFEALMMSLLEAGRVEDAKRCLQERLELEPRSSERFCENTTVNAAVGHYINWARRESIHTIVSINIPNEIGVDSMELAITVSNLLENAIHACQKLPESERYLKMTAKYKSQLLLEIENPFDGNVTMDEDGHPATQEENHGIGTRSVLAFVNKTGSQIMYTAENKVFRVRMIVGT